MATGDRRHSKKAAGASRQRSGGRALRRSTGSLVVLVLLLAAAALQFDLGRRWLGWDYPSPVDEPAAVAPPPGLSLPDVVRAPVVAEATPDRAADPQKVRRAVRKPAADKKLGRRTAIMVAQLSDGATVYASGSSRVTPASTMKMLTTAAALETLGPDHRFRTTVVAGRTPREVVLVGGGDPLLARAPATEQTYPPRADLQTLARATARKLETLGRQKVRLGYDTSLFSGPGASPDWPASYVQDDVVTEISPLWVDEGVLANQSDRSREPAADAARIFAKELARRDITVVGRPREVVAPADAVELAHVESAPLAQVVQWVLEVSDNEGAEVLFRHVALAEGEPGSFDGGGRAVQAVLSRLGVDTADEVILDGSGLSRDNRLDPATLVEVIGLAAGPEHPELRAVATDLPVAGFTGSLELRFDSGAAAGLGRVRAKTGTLTGVHGLAGVVTTQDDVELAFVVLADRVTVENTLAARDGIDRIAAALADCSCGASP